MYEVKSKTFTIFYTDFILISFFIGLFSYSTIYVYIADILIFFIRCLKNLGIKFNIQMPRIINDIFSRNMYLLKNVFKENKLFTFFSFYLIFNDISYKNLKVVNEILDSVNMNNIIMQIQNIFIICIS